MRKYGKVFIKNTGTEYSIFWSEEMGAERIDVTDRPFEYDSMVTSNCTASYFYKVKEHYLGDESVIKLIKRTKITALTLNVKKQQDITIKDGVVYITQIKEDPDIGVYYKLVMLNGEISSEVYETSDARVTIEEVDKDRGMGLLPVNLIEYQSEGIAEDYYQSDSVGAEYYSLGYLKAKHNLEHIEDNDFVVALSQEEAERRLQEWAAAPTKVKSIDVETTGLQVGVYGQDVITGISLSYSEADSTYFPFRQETWEYNCPIEFMQKLLDTVNEQPEDVMIITHNGVFEKKAFWKESPHYIQYSDFAVKFAISHGYDAVKTALRQTELRINRDTFFLSILVNPKIRKGLHSLKSLALKITGNFYLELEDIFKDKKSIRFNMLPPELVRYYACPDTANTIKVYNYLIKQLPADEVPLYDLECQLLKVTAINEFYGMRINKALLSESLANEEYKVTKLGKIFREIHHTTKNINSVDVRRHIFYEELRCPVEVRTKTGQPSTSVIALKRIVELGTLREYDRSKAKVAITDLFGKGIISGEDLIKNRYPSLVILNQYNKSMKELGAFRMIERKSNKDRVMFSINQLGAESGRQTSDAHQYSDGMKKLVSPDSEDHRLWSADFKQIELRILAYLAQQKDLIELESDMDVDVHRAILSIITGKPIYMISANERKAGKSVNFGVVYMMSAYGLAKREAGPAYTNEDYRKAAKSITDFYNALSDVKNLVEGNKKFVREHGYIMTRMRRRRYFKEILDPDLPEKKAASIERAANNTPVQGFCADFLKIVETKIQKYIEDHGWDELVDCKGVMLPKVRIMLSIHDEVLVSSHKSIPIEEIVTMFKVCMELKIKNAPPFFAAPALISNWLDGKNDAFEIDLRFRNEIVEAWDKERKTLLHVDSYMEGHGFKEVDKVLELCRALQRKYLGKEDFDKKGKLVLTDSTFDHVCSELTGEVMQTLKEHTLAPYDTFRTEEQECRAVISRALDKSFSPYLNDLNNFRAKRLNNYMEELIRKYQTADKVWQHVTHNELTHTLIQVYMTKDETKHWDHAECIKEATARYMNSRNEEATEQARRHMESTEGNADDNTAFIDTYDELSQYISFDDKGELIVEDCLDVEDAAEEDDLSTLEEVSSEDTWKTRSNVWYALNEVIVDLNEFDIDKEGEEINQEIARVCERDGAYAVIYWVNGKLVKSNLRINYKPDILNGIINKHLQGGRYGFNG